MAWNRYRADRDNSDLHVCKSVDEFLNALISLPTAFPEHNKHNINLIYRGHSSSSYRLLPTAFRDKTKDHAESTLKTMWDIHDGFTGIRCDQGVVESGALRNYELSIAKSFYRHAEKAGMHLPSVSESLHREMMTDQPGAGQRAAWDLNEKWPSDELLPIFALAQHYGIPTRLLDFSRSPLTTAYFAAEGAAKKIDAGNASNGNLCVWATLSNQFLGQIAWVPATRTEIDHFPHPIRLFQPSSALNPNLRRQQGVFLVYVDLPSHEPSAGISMRDATDDIAEKVPFNEIEGPFSTFFCNLLLPNSESAELLFRLQQLGYSKHRLIDGFDGIAQSVTEHAMLGRLIFDASENDPKRGLNEKMVRP